MEGRNKDMGIKNEKINKAPLHIDTDEIKRGIKNLVQLPPNKGEITAYSHAPEEEITDDYYVQARGPFHLESDPVNIAYLSEEALVDAVARKTVMHGISFINYVTKRGNIEYKFNLDKYWDLTSPKALELLNLTSDQLAYIVRHNEALTYEIRRLAFKVGIEAIIYPIFQIKNGKKIIVFRSIIGEPIKKAIGKRPEDVTKILLILKKKISWKNHESTYKVVERVLGHAFGNKKEKDKKNRKSDSK